jgi:hypothetical protein
MNEPIPPDPLAESMRSLPPIGTDILIAGLAKARDGTTSITLETKAGKRVQLDAAQKIN